MKRILLLIFGVFLAAAAFSQTAADVEKLLDESGISCGQASWFVLAAVLDQPPSDQEAAFALAKEQGMLPAKSENDSRISCSGLSFLVMKAFNLKGGMMYRLTDNKRYAYRELKDRGIITGRAYSNKPVSGEQLLQMLINLSDDGGAW